MERCQNLCWSVTDKTTRAFRISGRLKFVLEQINCSFPARKHLENLRIKAEDQPELCYHGFLHVWDKLFPSPSLTPSQG